MKDRNYTIDLFKYLAALCIIAIHTEPFSGINENLNFFVVQVLARLAVPFFAICSGYFAVAKLSDNRISNFNTRRVFLGQWKKLIFLYGIWSVLYLLFSIPMWIRIKWFSAWAFVDYVIAAVKSGSHYHLWYLLSLIYAWPVFSFCLRKMKRKHWLLASVVLYYIETIRYCYVLFLPLPIKKVFEILEIWGGLSTGLFLILPLMLLGAYLYEVPKMKAKSGFAFIISFFLLTCEAVLLNRIGQSKVSYILFTYPTGFFFFQFLVGCNESANRGLYSKLGEVSLFVYCFHPMAVELLGRISILPLLRFIIVVIVSTVLGLLWGWIKKSAERKKVCFH